MWLLSAAALLALCKTLAYLGVLDVGGVSRLSWWWVIAGFGLSAAWFAYADHSGLTQRKAMVRMEKRRQQRLQKQRERLGAWRKR